MKKFKEIELPRIVSRDEWFAVRQALLAKKKEFTRQCDALNAERRRLPLWLPTWPAP